MDVTLKKTALKCRILNNECAGGGAYKLTVSSKELAAAAPGQFAMLKCGGGAYLRRPFSIGDVGDEPGCAIFYYRLAGAGTYELSRRKEGDSLDIIGPLGNGFDISSVAAAAPAAPAVVGGGIGVFPLLLLSRRLWEKGFAPDIFAGYRDGESVVLERELKYFSHKFTLASDDGSAGIKGYVTDAFEKSLAGGKKYSGVYACGPVRMLNALQKICGERGINAQFSLEQRMGCGIGACRACACAVKSINGADFINMRDEKCESAEDKNDHSNDGVAYTYARVCKDGPVFAADALLF